MEITSEFKKNYTDKISKKVICDTSINEKSEIPNDINNLIIFLNYCFLKRNNFFIPNFNSYKVKNVCTMYNQLKTNILTKTIIDIFENIDFSNIKILRFIVSTTINNYAIISDNNAELCSIISRDSFQRLLVIINNVLKLKSQE